MAQRKALELGRDIAVGGTLCTVGDGAAQYAFTDTFDGRRLGAMTSYGSWSAVIYHYWYAFLARRLPPTAYMQKAALDCFVVTPGFEIPALMTWTGILGRGQSVIRRGSISTPAGLPDGARGRRRHVGARVARHVSVRAFALPGAVHVRLRRVLGLHHVVYRVRR